jgi:hypothetical protein
MKPLRASLFLLVLVIPAFSQSNTDYVEVRLIEKILIDMTDKQPVNVCVINYDANKILNYSKCLRITKCENADFMIIGKDSEEIDRNKPAIVFGEDLIKKVKNTISALYWKKDRPQLIFIKNRLDKYKIQLPSEYKGYLVDEPVLSKILNSSNIKDIYLARGKKDEFYKGIF